MIRIAINPKPLDPTQRVANLIARVFREFADQKKSSTVLEVVCGNDTEPVRLQLRLLKPRVQKGASRRKLPAMTR